MWRKPGEELRENNFLLPATCGGRGRFTVWGCMKSSGVKNLHLLEGIMNKHFSVNVLRDYLKASVKNLGFKSILHFTTTITQNILYHFERSGTCKTAQK
jgi:hypothetical protein